MNISKFNEFVKASKLSKVQISKKCNISRTTLDNVLQGADAKISTIEVLAKVFRVPVGYFFDDDPSSNNIVANGDSSVAAVNSHVNVNSDTEILSEKVKYLEQLLAEKERTIKILMERK